MTELQAACLHALRHNLGLKDGERVLVLTDREKLSLGRAFAHAARAVTHRVEVVEIPVAKHNGQEPPQAVAHKMQAADVVCLPLSKSLSWTKARSEACKAGARIASMAGGLTEATVLRTFTIDYAPIKQRVNRLCDRLDAAKTVRITSAAGTDLSFSVAGRKGRGRKAGIYTAPGAWGNLPCGEAFIAPMEGSAEGHYVVDASHAGVGKIEVPIRITVQRGLVTRVEGGAEARALSQLLAGIDDERAYNIAEFGVGCNEYAKLSGATIEDEKVLGTCHLALGSNIFFGGKVEVSVHLDGVLRAPTVFLDGEKILERGRLLV